MQELVAGRHHGSGGRVGRGDWHTRMCRTLYFVLTLSAGVMVGIVVTLQLVSYVRISGITVFSSPRLIGHETLLNRGMGDEELLGTVGLRSLQGTKWGDISMCDAERRLLANALLDQDNERFILLSESCAPLWNFTFTYNYLVNSNQSFVGVFDDPSVVGRGRYDPRMLPEVSINQWRKGAQWFEVDRELAVYIVSDVKYYPKFRDFCQPVCYVDEHYIPTMLFIEFQEKVAMRSVTAVDWGNGGSHPEEFGKDNAAEFYKLIRSDHDCVHNNNPGHVCYLFARKFLPDSLQPLLSLSN